MFDTRSTAEILYFLCTNKYGELVEANLKRNFEILENTSTFSGSTINQPLVKYSKYIINY